MKNLSTISLFIFGVVVTAILTAGLVFYQGNSSNNSAKNPAADAGGQKTAMVLNWLEINKHNSSADCWLVINNKVYAVTSVLSAHPGGAQAILPHCGQEATQAFKTKDMNKPHSALALNQLNDYYLGDFNQAVGQTAAATTPLTSKPPLNSSGASAPLETLNPPAKKPPVNQPNITLTAAVVAKHNITADCWLIANNKIYNVTSYLSAHPGGVKAISPYCGLEATRAFTTKGGQGSHSTNAHDILASYFIANLNQTVSQQKVQQSITTTDSKAPAATGAGNNNDDDDNDDDNYESDDD